MPRDGAVMLARLRATRGLSRPHDPAKLRTLRAAAGRAGRVLIQTRTGDGPGVLLGWLEGSEPPGGDAGVGRRQAAPTVLLTFAVCLRACWPDPTHEPYPGAAASERQVLAALAALTSDVGQVGEASRGAERHHKGALRLLRATGLLDPDPECVRLGPVVALWPPADVACLRTFYQQLPAPPPEETG